MSEIKYIPAKETQTLEDLKELGFIGHNLIEVKFPFFYFNPITREIVYTKEHITDPAFSEKVVKAVRFFPNTEQLERHLAYLNSCQLIAWFAHMQYGSDIAYHIRYRVLIGKDGELNPEQ